jgi:hypothetical protein
MKILVNKETCFLKLNINLTVIEQRFGRKLIPPIDPSMNLKTLSTSGLSKSKLQLLGWLNH